MEEDLFCEPILVELFHQYQARLKKYDVSLAPYKDSFRINTGNGNSTYVKTIHDVITFYNGFSASIEQEATKREKLIELLMAENRENKEVITNNDPLGLFGTPIRHKPGATSLVVLPYS